MLRTLAVLSVLFVSMVAFAGDPNDPQQITVVSEKAFEEDVRTGAESTGLTEDEVAKFLKFQSAFSDLLEKVYKLYPNQISYVFMDDIPATAAYIRFVGDVPESFESLIAKYGSLEENLTFWGHGKIANYQHTERVRATARALRDLGHVHSIVSFDPTREVLELEIQEKSVDKMSSNVALAEAISRRFAENDILRGPAKALYFEDFEAIFIKGEGPMINFDNLEGGTKIYGPYGSCTTSFTAVHPVHGRGVLTAGHCNNLNKVKDPGSTTKNCYSIVEHVGTGDSEFLTTTGSETNKFYTSYSNRRTCSGVKSTGSMAKGNGVYGYSRNLGHSGIVTIDKMNAAGNVGSTTIYGLVRTTQNFLSSGDSGGPMYVDNDAWGLHMGHSSANSNIGYFTPAQTAESQLGIDILVVP